MRTPGIRRRPFSREARSCTAPERTFDSARPCRRHIASMKSASRRVSLAKTASYQRGVSYQSIASRDVLPKLARATDEAPLGGDDEPLERLDPTRISRLVRGRLSFIDSISRAGETAASGAGLQPGSERARRAAEAFEAGDIPVECFRRSRRLVGKAIDARAAPKSWTGSRRSTSPTRSQSTGPRGHRT